MNINYIKVYKRLYMYELNIGEVQKSIKTSIIILRISAGANAQTFLNK